MVKLNKKNIESVNKLLVGLPKELQEIILLKTFDKMAMKCYEDPEYLNICTKDKEKICKQLLMDADYKQDIEKWVGKYNYLVKNLANIVKLISKLEKSDVKIDNKTKITNYMNGPRIFELSEDEYNTIPLDVINFVLKNRNRILYDDDAIAKIYKNVKEGRINNVDKILVKYYIPQEVKNDLIKIVIEKYNKEPNTGTVIDVMNNINIMMVEVLLQFGANKYITKNEFKKFGYKEFENIYK